MHPAGAASLIMERIDSLPKKTQIVNTLYRYIMTFTGLIRVVIRRIRKIYRKERDSLFESKFNALTAAEIKEIIDFLGSKQEKDSYILQKAPLFKNVFKLKMNLR